MIIKDNYKSLLLCMMILSRIAFEKVVVDIRLIIYTDKSV